MRASLHSLSCGQTNKKSKLVDIVFPHNISSNPYWRQSSSWFWFSMVWKLKRRRQKHRWSAAAAPDWYSRIWHLSRRLESSSSSWYHPQSPRIEAEKGYVSLGGITSTLQWISVVKESTWYEVRNEIYSDKIYFPIFLLFQCTYL